MKIGEVLKDKQPKEYNKIKPKKKRNRKRNKCKKEHKEVLSFDDVENLMKHDCYRRVNGAIRQVR